MTKDNASEVILTLVNGGALLDYRTREGLTPLHQAAASGKAMSVKVLSLLFFIQMFIDLLFSHLFSGLHC